MPHNLASGGAWAVTVSTRRGAFSRDRPQTEQRPDDPPSHLHGNDDAARDCGTRRAERRLRLVSVSAKGGPMPVTVKLSRQFYERLGDEVANELAEWLNTVDASYRSELRELFDASFGRVEARMGAVEARMGAVEDLMVAFEGRVAARMDALEARVDAKLERMKSELLKWMFLFWVGTMGTVLAILKL